MQPERVCKIIMACAVLHNIAVEMKEPMDDVDRTDDLNNDINIAFQGPDEGRVVRDYIARMFFSKFLNAIKYMYNESITFYFIHF